MVVVSKSTAGVTKLAISTLSSVGDKLLIVIFDWVDVFGVNERLSFIGVSGSD
jgi:hypothetical protein